MKASPDMPVARINANVGSSPWPIKLHSAAHAIAVNYVAVQSDQLVLSAFNGALNVEQGRAQFVTGRDIS